ATAQRPWAPRPRPQRAGHARRDRRARQADREGDPRRRVRDGDRDAERAVRRLAAGNARRGGGMAGVAPEAANAPDRCARARIGAAPVGSMVCAPRSGLAPAYGAALLAALAFLPACAGGPGRRAGAAPAPIAAAEHFVRRIDPFPVLDEHGRAYTYPFL